MKIVVSMHNQKVVGSNPTPATNLHFLSTGTSIVPLLRRDLLTSQRQKSRIAGHQAFDASEVTIRKKFQI